MVIIYTRHAIEKLRRADIKRFKIKKKTIVEALRNPKSQGRTKYGDFAVVSEIDQLHDLRVIYDIIGEDIKIITFHVARKGRYI